MTGPMLMTVAPELPMEDRFPVGWSGVGGAAGARLFRYGQFEVKETSPGFYGDSWLPNTRGPLAVAYCQSPVIVDMGEPLMLTQEQPLQLVTYNGVGLETTREHVTQIYHLRYVKPGEALTLLPPRLNTQSFAGWTRRFDEDDGRRPVFYLERSVGREHVKSLVVSHGDYRLVSGKRLVPSEMFMPHPETQTSHASHSLSWDLFDRGSNVNDQRGVSYTVLRQGIEISDALTPDYSSDASDRAAFAPLLGGNYQFAIDPSLTRDVETGFPSRPDGAYVRMPDEGGVNMGERYAYFDQIGPVSWQVSSAHVVPHRQVTSPIVFGAVPSASQAQVPWTTLLFRPHLALDQSSQEGQHLGQRGNGLRFEEEVQSLEGFAIPKFSSVRADASLPADHHWLDLFWMPPAAPARVVCPFATAGKVNMNYEMMPFRHIKRATALHAVLKSERLLAIPNWAGRAYKDEGNEFSWRHRIDAAETLKSFEAKFQRGELFLTESEICEHHLFSEGIPSDAEDRGIRQFWDAHRLSGDDILERLYANVHARLTTRSNACKLHFRIEVLKKSTETLVDSFVEGVDRVTGVKNGAKRLIRQLDVNDPRIPDYLGDRDH